MPPAIAPVGPVTPARVLVCTDNDEDAALVLGQLRGDFEQVRAATTLAQAVADVARHRPDVLVLGFDTLAKVHACHQTLTAAAPLRCRTVILCHKQEVRAAFELCRQQHFDDYVLFWPQFYDGARLAMSVWIALRVPLPALPPVLPPTPLTTSAPRALLVVEDDEFTRQLIGRMLAAQPYTLAYAGDAAEALQHLAGSVDSAPGARPAAILMDIRLPGQDGLALTRQLKASAALADIPIVMMTGDARRETLADSMAAGATAFLVKPFSREALATRLERVLGGPLRRD